MNIIGTWKIVAAAQLDGENGLVWKTPEEIIASGETNAETLKMSICFREGGVAETILPLPENMPQSEIDAAAESGMEFRNGCAILEKREWKEENGDFFYYDGSMGTILGEEASPWTKIIFNDGTIDFGMLRLEKIEE